MPYRYLSTASYALYMKITVFIWLSWIIFVSLPFIGVLSTMQYNIGLSAIFLFVILLVLVSYWRIYRIVVEQRRKIATVSGLTKPTCETASVLVAAWKNMNVQETFSSYNDGLKDASPGAHKNTNLEGHPEEILKDDSRSRTSICLHVKNNEQCCCDTGNLSLQIESKQYDTVLSACTSLPQICDLSTAKGYRKKCMERLRRFANEQKQAKTIAIIIVTLILCYLPQIVLLQIRAGYGDSRYLLNFDAWADLLVFLNSSLNPLIYCHRNKDMQLALKNIFKRTMIPH